MNTNEEFEKNAEKFRKDTGIWPLGKDRAAAAGPIDERDVRSMAYIYWKKQQPLQAENAKLKVLLGRYGRHDATCEGRVATHPRCQCGWWQVAEQYQADFKE